MVSVSMTVNGKQAGGEVEPRTLLVDFLRSNLGLTGTHVGCDTSQCGACVVHVNGDFGEVLHHARGPGRRRQGHDDRGPGPGRHAASAAGGVPRASRPAVRLLYARHAHERRRPAAEEPAARASARCASGSRGTSAAAPATTTSSRRSSPPLPTCRATVRRPSEGPTMAEKGIGVAVPRKEDQRFITGKGRYTDDINQHGQAHAYFVRSPHAHAPDQRHRQGLGRGHARRAGGAHRRGRQGRRPRQPDLRLAGQVQGRLAR